MDIYASDEEKAEAIKQWWRDNGRSVVAGVLLGTATIFGFRYWIAHQHMQDQTASALYQQASIEIMQGESEASQQSVQALTENYASTAYAVFAALQLAEKAASDNDTQTAASYLEWVIENAKLTGHVELAKLRLAKLKLSLNDLEAASELANSTDSVAFRSLFTELQGDILVAQGDSDAARDAYQQAMASLMPGEPRQSLLQLKLDDVAVANES